MLGETHKRIARKIAGELELEEREAELLEAGSVIPDSLEDFPHHAEKEGDIEENIMEARRLFVLNDDECYSKLGVAFHYIQDMWTLRPRARDKHTMYEVQIDQSLILADHLLENEIRRIAIPTKAQQAYLEFLELLRKIGTEMQRLSQQEAKTNKGKLKTACALKHDVLFLAIEGRPTEYSQPLIDVNFSYRICSAIAKGILSDGGRTGDWQDLDVIEELDEETWKDLDEENPIPELELEDSNVDTSASPLLWLCTGVFSFIGISSLLGKLVYYPYIWILGVTTTYLIYLAVLILYASLLWQFNNVLRILGMRTLNRGLLFDVIALIMIIYAFL